MKKLTTFRLSWKSKNILEKPSQTDFFWKLRLLGLILGQIVGQFEIMCFPLKGDF